MPNAEVLKQVAVGVRERTLRPESSTLNESGRFARDT